MLVLDDLKWFFSVESTFSRLTLNEFSQEQLHNIILAATWKSIVHDNIEKAHKAGYLSVPVANPAAAQISCSVCSKVCNNSHVLAGHMYKIHNVRHPARLFAGSEGKCLICLKLFHNRPRIFIISVSHPNPVLSNINFTSPPPIQMLLPVLMQRIASLLRRPNGRATPSCLRVSLFLLCMVQCDPKLIPSLHVTSWHRM